MRAFADAHALIWYSIASPRLSATAGQVMADPANEIFASAASLWEIAIKVGTGKLALGRSYGDFLDVCLNYYGFVLYPIEPRHFVAVAALPYPSAHRDPFDRILAVQAVADGVKVVSADTALDQPVRRRACLVSRYRTGKPGNSSPGPGGSLRGGTGLAGLNSHTICRRR